MEINLYRIAVNGRHPDARRDMGNRYEMHRTLRTKVFSGIDDDKLHLLWRLETRSYNVRSTTLLVQSIYKGDWNQLPEGYALSDVESKVFSPTSFLRTGNRYRFRLEANVSLQKGKMDESLTGKRVGIVGIEAQKKWLVAKGEKSGFVVEGAEITFSDKIKFGGRKKITMAVVRFDGILQVNDSVVLADVLANGIGRGKAFGLGLLSLAKA